MNMFSIGTTYKNIGKYLADLLFPIYCLGCKTEGEWLCESCLRGIALKEQLTCPLCPSEAYYGVCCDKCRTTSGLDGIVVAGDYHDALLQRAIKTLKYRFIAALGTGLGELLARRAMDNIKRVQITSWLGGGVQPRFFASVERAVVMPLPLHPRRQRWRGFNQSAQLAQAVAKKLQLTYNDIDLKRVRYTTPQAKLHARERQANIAGAFAWRGGSLAGKEVILIDDVVTTGATLVACAQVLKTAGAAAVWGLVVARN